MRKIKEEENQFKYLVLATGCERVFVLKAAEFKKDRIKV